MLHSIIWEDQYVSKKAECKDGDEISTHSLATLHTCLDTAEVEHKNTKQVEHGFVHCVLGIDTCVFPLLFCAYIAQHGECREHHQVQA